MLVTRYIYCTSSQYATFYKIGITKNLQQRLKDANTCSHAWAIQDWKYEFAIEVDTEYDGGNYYEREATLHDVLVGLGATRIGRKEQFTNLSLEKIRQLFRLVSSAFVDPATAPAISDEVVSEDEEEQDVEVEAEPRTKTYEITNYLTDGQVFQVLTKFKDPSRPPVITDAVFRGRSQGWYVEFPDGIQVRSPTEILRYARFLTGASQDDLETERKEPKTRIYVNGKSIFADYKKLISVNL